MPPHIKGPVMAGKPHYRDCVHVYTRGCLSWRHDTSAAQSSVTQKSQQHEQRHTTRTSDLNAGRGGDGRPHTAEGRDDNGCSGRAFDCNVRMGSGTSHQLLPLKPLQRNGADGGRALVAGYTHLLLRSCSFTADGLHFGVGIRLDRSAQLLSPTAALLLRTRRTTRTSDLNAGVQKRQSPRRMLETS